MGDVHNMRTSSLQSPAEAPSPVAAPRSDRRPSSQSTPSAPLPNNRDGQTQGGNLMLEDSLSTAETLASSVPQDQTTTDPTRLLPSAGKTDPDSTNEGHGNNGQTIQQLRKQMEELLVYQQMQQPNKNPTLIGREPPSRTESLPHDSTQIRRNSNPPVPQIAPPGPGALYSASHSDSTGSGDTLRPRDSSENQHEQTPSYPFPKMQSHPTAQNTQASDPPDHFKLTLPAEKLKLQLDPSGASAEHQMPLTKTPASNSAFLPSQQKPVAEDPVYPSPNLYDLTLRLNADPGLDSWWSNVVNILQMHYGAERVSLAVPGDATDLENVPWGQKAVFNQHLPEESDAVKSRYLQNEELGLGDATIRGGAGLGSKKGDTRENTAKGPGSVSPLKRPPPISRHSFAGFGKERKSSTLHDSDHSQHPKMKTLNRFDTKHAPIPSEDAANTGVESLNQDDTTPQTHAFDLNSHHNFRQAVFPIPRPLEVEGDPLIKRTGVVKLFGRTTPVVLTREYSQEAAEWSMSQAAQIRTPNEKVQVTPTSAPSQTADQASLTTRARSTSTLSASGLRSQMGSYIELFDEYEQIAPSPWTQSPAPSPAPRTHADQNPFFTNHAVDESAFAKHPPAHDYSKREPLEAIGVDLARSVVHIPLVHAGPSKQTSPSTLRFPVAVISILSPVNPYPSNLRLSLAYLMPHLTTSFCLAQQYSQLERQFASRLETPRYGHLLGLGGTFSDESSELELVAGLSGQVNYALADDGSLSARASLSSPDERSNSARFSPSVSGLGTPGLDLNIIGSNNPGESPGAVARANGDPGDSYFNVQYPKSFRDVVTQHRGRLSKVKQNAEFSMPSSPGKLWGKSSADEEPDPNQLMASPQQEPRGSAAMSPSNHIARHQSTNSLYAQLQRELPRPFSDTVAQLMLNSIPLHLFLAKPQSGEVIWTNSKFDAYRRSQPQEQRMRDPWQNIHGSEREHVSQEWTNALRTGSQFTERVRVKRFNDESAYRWFIFRANPLISATGEVLYWIGSFLDIHEQHIAELKAAQEREKFATDAKYRAFSNSIPQVVFEAAEYRGLIFANEQWHLYTGQKLEEAMNFGFAKHVHPDDLEKCGHLSLQLAESSQSEGASGTNNPKGDEPSRTGAASPERKMGIGVTPALNELVRRGVVSMQRDENGRVFYSTEIRLRSKGGDFRWHLVRLVRVETSSFGSGENSWYGTCTDINDRKNLERELNKAMQQLNNQMESKTKFFSNMSHEIRTPLNGILGTIPFILDTPLDADQRRMLDTIQNSSTNLRELVDNILDVSRVEAGKMSLVNSWFHVRSVIEDVIDTVASRAIDKGLEINYLMDVDVPAMMVGDRFRVRQVLINLVGNAVKFTAQGEIYIHCSIYHHPAAMLKATEFLLNFDVVDTGKGFSARDAERLMHRFSQLGQNGSQQHAGSGLGLFLSKQLVEMHGGRLTPSSKEGQGAKFSFYVKVDVPPPPTPEEPRPIHEELQRAQSKASPLQKALMSKEPVDSKGTEVSEHPPLGPSLSDSSARRASNLSELSPVSSPASATPEPNTTDHLAKVDSTKTLPSEPDAVHARDSAMEASSDYGLHAAQPGSSAQEPTTENVPARTPSVSHPKDPYTIMILCPLDNARAAIKQHIEQVVPLEVPYSVTSLPDVEDWRDMVNAGSCSRLTHLVLNVLNVDDGLEVVQYISEYDPASAPTLVVIVDLYQKRQINPRIKELSASGRRAYTVPKPIKPSAFSAIFDPDNQRDLSKDRNRDMARESNNNFKTMSKMVKEVIGNKGYRILLVEDDETNRMVGQSHLVEKTAANMDQVMLKYLDKVKVISETAGNGEECTELVFSKEPGYYSLIIVSRTFRFVSHRV